LAKNELVVRMLSGVWMRPLCASIKTLHMDWNVTGIYQTPDSTRIYLRAVNHFDSSVRAASVGKCSLRCRLPCSLQVGNRITPTSRSTRSMWSSEKRCRAAFEAWLRQCCFISSSLRLALQHITSPFKADLELGTEETDIVGVRNALT
jgi:hypothetical protein